MAALTDNPPEELVAWFVTDASHIKFVTVMAFSKSIGWKKRVFCPPVRAVAGPPFDQDDIPPFCAVMVDPLRPKEIPLLFEKTMAVKFWLVEPADTLIDAAVGGTTEAVIVEPFKPNETPFEFEKTMALRF